MKKHKDKVEDLMCITAPIALQMTQWVTAEDLMEGERIIYAALTEPGLDRASPFMEDLGSTESHIHVKLNDKNPEVRVILRLQSYFRKKAGLPEYQPNG